MGLKLYITSITPNMEVKKRAQRIRMVLESVDIQVEVIDISQTGKELEKEFMRNNCKVENGPPAQPPQIFNDKEYCGGYDEFENAVEIHELWTFLKLDSHQVSTENEMEDEAWYRGMQQKRKQSDEQEETAENQENVENDEENSSQPRKAQKKKQMIQKLGASEDGEKHENEEEAEAEEDEKETGPEDKSEDEENEVDAKKDTV